MSTAEQLRKRLAELNRDTAQRLRGFDSNAAPRGVSGRVGPPSPLTNAPAGTSFTPPNTTVVDRTVAQPNRMAGLGQRVNSATSGARSFLTRPVDTVSSRALGSLGRGVGNAARFAGRGFTGPLGLATLAGGVGFKAATAANNATGRVTSDVVSDFMSRITGQSAAQENLLSDDPAVAAQARLDTGTDVLPPQRVAPVIQETGLSSVFGEEPSMQPRQRGGQVRPDLGGPAVPGAPLNSLLAGDGRVFNAMGENGGDTSARVNTMSADDFVRPIGAAAGNAQRDAVAAQEQAEADLLNRDRTAFRGQLSRVQENARQQDIREATRTLETRGGNPTIRAAMQARLEQLNTQGDQSTDLGVAQINADGRQVFAQDPMMSPSVIAERLRQDGNDRRAAGKPDEVSELFRGLEPMEDIQGNVTGFQGTDSQGTPIVIPESLLLGLSTDFQRRRESGDIPVTQSFADYVSLLQANAGQSQN